MTVPVREGGALTFVRQVVGHHKVRKLYHLIRGIVEFKPIEGIALGGDLVDNQSNLCPGFDVIFWGRIPSPAKAE